MLPTHSTRPFCHQAPYPQSAHKTFMSPVQAVNLFKQNHNDLFQNDFPIHAINQEKGAPQAQGINTLAAQVLDSGQANNDQPRNQSDEEAINDTLQQKLPGEIENIPIIDAENTDQTESKKPPIPLHESLAEERNFRGLYVIMEYYWFESAINQHKSLAAQYFWSLITLLDRDGEAVQQFQLPNKLQWILCFAECYEKGEEVAKDLKKAAFLFRKAADIVLNDRTISLTINQTINIFKKAAQLSKHLPSICWLGKYYYENKKFEKAVKYFQQAQEFGNPIGMHFLAECFIYGRAVKKDLQQAKILLKKAVELMYIPSYAILGSLYLLEIKGNNSDADNYKIKLVSEILQKAIEGGDPLGQLLFGILCFRGLGPKDKEHGIALIEDAASSGNCPKAVEWLSKQK